MLNDIWHYPRTKLAEQVINMFDTGLSSALVFFAPRRMGKTEFLLKDIKPLAEKIGWSVFYFSFLDVYDDARTEFTKELEYFAIEKKLIPKPKALSNRISKLKAGIKSVVTAEVELRKPQQLQADMKKIISNMAKHKILLLLDEIQVLADDAQNKPFVAALRTVLDIHKDSVKVIFTGSSREGLRRMFSEASAPFFHFGQNLPFPELEQSFVEHFAATFKLVSKRSLNTEELWLVFQKLQKIPQLLRTLVERLVLHPTLTITAAMMQITTELSEDRKFIKTWGCASALNRLLLLELARDKESFFSEESRNQFAVSLGINEVSVSQVQSALRSLQRDNLIGRHPEDRGGYFIEDPNFKNWILQQ